MYFNPKTLLLPFLLVGHLAYGQIPITLPDAESTPEETPVSLKILDNDTDLLDTIDPTSVDLDPSTPAIDNIFVKTGEGTFTVDMDGIVTFSPELNFFGNSVASYTVENQSNVTSLPASITITVTSVNDAPVANNDNANTNEDVAIIVDVVANDSDVDNAIEENDVDLIPGTPAIDASFSDATGTFTALNGEVTYTPALHYNGSATVSYNVEDISGAKSNIATLSITVAAVNDPPVANADTETTAEDTDVSFEITSNDTDVDGSVNEGTVDLDPTSLGMQTMITTTAGTFTYDGAGEVTYDPVANFNGTATISYNVQDNLGVTSNNATITVTVTAVNDAPVAVADATATAENTNVNLNVVTNDTDPDNNINAAAVDLNTASAGIQNTNTTAAGDWSVNGSGVVTFDPAVGFNGNAVLNYTVDDLGGLTSNAATITITVSSVNDAPVANNDATTTPEDDDVTINVVSNDTDPDGSINVATVDLDILTAGIQNTMTTVDGDYAVNALGVVTFTPALNFHGTVSLQYNVQDNDGLTSNNATISVTVSDINDAPVAVNDASATSEETAVSVNVIANDTDVDGTIAAGTVDLNVSTGGIQTTITTAEGTFSVNGSGLVTFTPVTNYNGTAVLSYTVNDDDGTPSNQATITITVSSDNDLPVAANDATTTSEEIGTTLNVVSNDNDPDGTINASSVDLNTSTAGIQNTASVTGGSFSVNASGVVSFTPTANFNGVASVSYTVNDNDGGTSNVATISITVTAVNDPPQASNDATTTDEETAVTLSVIANDSDIDGTISANTVDLDTSTPGIQNSIATAAGSFSVNGAGTVTFTPAANFNGIATVTYTVNDNGGATSNQATISITVNEENDSPIAVADATNTNEDTAVTLNVVTNDSDPDGTINAATVDLNTTLAGIQNTNSNASGTYSVNSSGVVTFTPAANFNGSAVLNYTVQDSDGANSNQAAITITVNAINDAPVAVADAASTNEGVAVTVNVVTNDTDVDGSVAASTVDLNVTSAGIQNTNTTVAGTFTVNNAGHVTFTPLSSFNGVATLEYTVQDNSSAVSNQATITITVNSINDLPVAVDDAATTNEDVAVTVNVVANDADEDGTINTATVDLNISLAGIQNTNSNASGSFSVNASGVVTYTPAANYNGVGALQYRVNDNDGGTSNSATISITVTSINDVPVANNDAVSTNEDVAAVVNVVANDTDVDGTINAATVDLNPLSAGIQSTATISGGTLAVSAVGIVTFTPTVNFYGNTSATYTVNDNSGATSSAATISFTVNAINDPPIANNDITSADENETVTLNVVTNDLDIDGAINAATVDLNPSSGGIQATRTIAAGTFTVNNAGVVTFTPTTNFNGIASITYTVQDDAGTTSNAATITVTINSVNSDPVANNDSGTTNEDNAVSFNVTTNDTDADGTINTATVDLNTTSAGIQNSNTIAEGVFTVNSTGVVTFTPTSNFNGTAAITYTVNDNVGTTSNAATITVTVNSVNDVPVANADATSTTEGTAVTITVTTNDTDVDGSIDPATVDLNTTTAGIQNTNTTAAGTFSVNASGVVTFTPVGTFSGAATLSYRVNDNSGGTSNSATLTITVTSVNDAPVANNDATSTNEDTSVTLNVVSNDTDEDGTVSAATVDLNTTSAGIQNTITTSEGTFTVNASGVVSFSPVANFTGSASTTYTVNDNGGLTSNIATITITVSPVNDSPVASNDILTTNEDEVATLNILSNDTDPDGTIDATTVDLNTATVLVDNTHTTTAGTFTVNASGLLTFTPKANFAGNATLTYRVKDNNGAVSNIATINITVNGINDPPTFDEFSEPTVRVYKNSGQRTVSITGISPGALETENMLITATSSNTEVIPNPTVTYNGSGATGSLTFTPVAGKSGTVTVTVKVVDTALNEFTRTFTIIVIDVKISSQPGTVATLQNPYSYQVVVQVTPESERSFVDPQVSVITKPAWLTFTAATQTLSGTPPANAALSNPIKIQVKPKNVNTVVDEQTYTLTINSAPVASDFNIIAQEDISRPFTQDDFNSAFNDPNGDLPSKIVVLSLPQNGSLRLGSVVVAVNQEISYSAIPTLSYLSNADFSGSDAFTWKGYDAFAESNVAAVNVTVTAVNDPPVITAIESTTLSYDQGLSQPILVTEEFDAKDDDSPMLLGARVYFKTDSEDDYRPGHDQLIFFDTEKITGLFNSASGMLTLSGEASTQEYVEAIRTVRYNFVDFDGILDDPRTLYFTLSDENATSEPRERAMLLDYSFEGLDIPTAFTPNGDEANDFWVITSGGSGATRFNDAEIKVYNQRGMLVYEAKGFDEPWDGMMNGEVLPSATYYFTIDLKFDNKIFKGIVTILR